MTPNLRAEVPLVIDLCFIEIDLPVSLLKSIIHVRLVFLTLEVCCVHVESGCLDVWQALTVLLKSTLRPSYRRLAYILDCQDWRRSETTYKVDYLEIS